MQREGSALRTFRIVAMVLLVLAVSIGIVSYLYVVGRQDYLSKRNFRLLAVQSTQFKQRIEIYSHSVLSNLVDYACNPQSSKRPDPCGIKALSGQVQILQSLFEKHTGTDESSGQSNGPRTGAPAGKNTGSHGTSTARWLSVEQV